LITCGKIFNSSMMFVATRITSGVHHCLRVLAETGRRENGEKIGVDGKTCIATIPLENSGE
jgi:hypothetical protein